VRHRERCERPRRSRPVPPAGQGQDDRRLVVGGGSAITTTHVHRLNGPEHTLATDDDRLNATGGEPGLLPKLSGITTDTLHGDGTWSTDAGSSGDAELNIEGGQSVIKAHGSMGSTETFDPTDGNVHTGTLNANCTFTLNAPTGSGAALLELWLTQDGTGGWDDHMAGFRHRHQGTLDTTAGTTSRVISRRVDGGTSWIARWSGRRRRRSPPRHRPRLVGCRRRCDDGHPLRRHHRRVRCHVPVTQAFSDAAATGSAAFAAARRDHVHGMPATPSSGGGGEHAHVAERRTSRTAPRRRGRSIRRSSPGPSSRGTPRRSPPDRDRDAARQATVSAAGTTGDKIVFDYAARSREEDACPTCTGDRSLALTNKSGGGVIAGDVVIIDTPSPQRHDRRSRDDATTLGRHLARRPRRRVR
jgi:hypothetical protein